MLSVEKVYDELYGMIDDLKKQIAAGGGGDEVTITPALESGTKVADYTIGEDSGSLYAPAPYTPLDYSTNEQDTGIKWIDGSEIYVKSYDFGSDKSCASQAWTYFDDTTIDGHAFNVDIVGVDSSGTVYRCIGSNYSNDKIGIMNTRSTNINIRYLTIWYTKNPPTEAKKTKKK